jgi:hypothetical protein
MQIGIFAIYIALTATLFSTQYYIKAGNLKDSLSVILTGINADRKSILLNMNRSASNDKSINSPYESIVVEISHKPLMSILWLGTILITIGSVMALRKRIQMNGRR